MPDREKVMRGLEYCARSHQSLVPCTKDCVYYAHMAPPCIAALAEDALALLKAQVPRVMTLEEIEQRVGEFNPDPVFVEWRSGYMHWVLESIGAVACAVRSEGEFVRVWTSRPTEEQRKAVKWDE